MTQCLLAATYLGPQTAMRMHLNFNCEHMLKQIDCRIDITTMFKIREWERYQFMIDYEHRQARKYSEACPQSAAKQFLKHISFLKSNTRPY